MTIPGTGTQQAGHHGIGHQSDLFAWPLSKAGPFAWLDALPGRAKPLTLAEESVAPGRHLGHMLLAAPVSRGVLPDLLLDISHLGCPQLKSALGCLAGNGLKLQGAGQYFRC